jgi:hypothetical protein
MSSISEDIAFWEDEDFLDEEDPSSSPTSSVFETAFFDSDPPMGLNSVSAVQPARITAKVSGKKIFLKAIWNPFLTCLNQYIFIYNKKTTPIHLRAIYCSIQERYFGFL